MVSADTIDSEIVPKVASKASESGGNVTDGNLSELAGSLGRMDLAVRVSVLK